MTETGTGPLGLTEEIQNMTPDQAVKMVRELCAQLVSEGAEFHGNIWPGNVSRDEAGKALLGEGSDAPANARAAAQVEFLAPEYFWDNTGDGATDVYSLGMLLYTACNNGYLPFQPKGGALTEKDRSGALRKRMKGELVTVPSGMSRELAAVIRKALAYEPEDRYQSPAELLSALGATDEALPAPEYDALAVEGMAAAAAAAEAKAALDLESEAEEPEAEAAEPAPEEPELAAVEPEEETPVQPEVTAIHPEEKRYTVQKDFEKIGRKKAASAAPATRQKKKTSPAIPILCVAAAAIIGGAAWYGVNHLPSRAAEPVPADEVSEPYVIIPAENPETTLHPAALEDEAEPTPTPEPEESPSPEEPVEEEEVITGSATVDGQDVEPVSDTVYVTGAGVNLRSGPGTAYEIAKTITRGTELKRTGTVNGWSQVQYEGKEYYISTNLISTDDPNGEKTPAESADSKSDNKNESADTKTDTKSDTKSDTKTDNKSDTKTDNKTSGGSAPTSGGSGSGTTAPAASNTTPAAPAVSATRDVISVTGAEVNLRTGPGTNNSVVTTVPAGTVLQRTGTTNGWNRVVYKGQEVYISDSMTKAVTGSEVTNAVGTLKVASDVNVRSGANTDSSILGVAKVGTALPTTGITDGGKWYRVSYDGKEGYVNRKLVNVEDLALVTKESGTAKVTTRANIRSGPATDYTVLGVAEVGDSLTVTGLADNNWYEVSYDGKVGYVSANLVEK